MSRLLSGHILQIKNSGLLNSALKNIKQKQHFCKQWKNVAGKISCRQLSHKTKTITDNVQSTKSISNKKKDYTPFSEFINFRKEEARRSIIVQVQSAYSYKELHAYCSQMGLVNKMFHYSSGVEPLHFILVEFASEDDVKNILSTSCHIDDSQAVPVRSPFLWFRVAGTKKSSLKLSKSFKLCTENGNKIPSYETVRELLQSAENISDQMRILHEVTKLNDLGIRLRFLTARQVELAVSGMFPDAVAYPFGSSINGYGKLGCDLDLILKLNGNIQNTVESRLVYQCKAGLGNERSQSQRHMEAIGDLLHLFLPGCSQVRRILQARVPILKYNQQFTNIECDLSMTNMIALHMSELLYLFGSIDNRVKPLVFTIRKWAREVGLTNASPGRWISNFSLTLLVLAFLQRTPSSVPILPPVNTLVKLAEEKDVSIVDDGVNCTFLRDLTKLKNLEKNTESLQVLLLQFFEYYANFDFESKAISLNEAAAIKKPENTALYIVNPLERGLNVSKNVSIEELERLRIELRNAAWALESQENKRVGKWGILSIFETNHKSNPNQKIYYHPTRQSRLMEVKKLFEEEQYDDELFKNESPDFEFKNEAVKKEMENIKKETAKRIEEIKGDKGKSSKRQTAKGRR